MYRARRPMALPVDILTHSMFKKTIGGIYGQILDPLCRCRFRNGNSATEMVGMRLCVY